MATSKSLNSNPRVRLITNPPSEVFGTVNGKTLDFDISKLDPATRFIGYAIEGGDGTLLVKVLPDCYDGKTVRFDVILEGS